MSEREKKQAPDGSGFEVPPAEEAAPDASLLDGASEPRGEIDEPRLVDSPTPGPVASEPLPEGLTEPQEPALPREEVLSASEPPSSDSALPDVLARLEDRLAEGQRLLARQIEISAKLHEENQRLKRGELRQAQAPLVGEVLRVHDDVAQMLRAPSQVGAAKDLEIVMAALVDALARNGIEALPCEAGEPFDPRAHKIAGIEMTADETANRQVASVVRPGFVWENGEVVRVGEVKVFKYRPAETPSRTSSPVPIDGTVPDGEAPSNDATKKADPPDGATSA